MLPRCPVGRAQPLGFDLCSATVLIGVLPVGLRNHSTCRRWIGLFFVSTQQISSLVGGCVASGVHASEELRGTSMLRVLALASSCVQKCGFGNKASMDSEVVFCLEAFLPFCVQDCTISVSRAAASRTTRFLASSELFRVFHTRLEPCTFILPVLQ